MTIPPVLFNNSTNERNNTQDETAELKPGSRLNTLTRPHDQTQPITKYGPRYNDQERLNDGLMTLDHRNKETFMKKQNFRYSNPQLQPITGT